MIIKHICCYQHTNTLIQSIVANIIPDLIVGITAAGFISYFFYKKGDLRSQIGALTIIQSEVSLNKQVLQHYISRHIPDFEKAFKRGSSDDMLLKHQTDDKYLTDIAMTFKVPIDHLVFSAFNSSYKDLAALSNKKLLADIIRYYSVSLQSNLQSGMNIGTINWPLIDEIKKVMSRIVKDAKTLDNDIRKEILKLKEQNKFKQIVREFFKASYEQIIKFD